MSNSEDYLDSLLNSINKVKEDINQEEETDQKRISSILSSPKIETDDDFLAATGLSDPFAGIVSDRKRTHGDLDFLREFEEELKSGEADRFIRDFETELDEEEALHTPPLAEDSLMDSIEGIVSAAKKQAKASMAEDISAVREEAKADIAAEDEIRDVLDTPGMDLSGAYDNVSLVAENDIPEGDALEPDLAIPDLSDADMSEPDLSGLSLEEPDLSDMGLSDEEPGEGPGDDLIAGEPDLSLGEDIGLLDEDADIDLDSLAGDDEALGDIADLMNADAEGLAVEGAGDELDENTRRSLEGEDTQVLEKQKVKGFKGILQKFKQVLFGSDDEDEAPKDAGIPDMTPDEYEGLSDEQIGIMKNLAGDTGDSGAAAPAAAAKGEGEEEEGGKKGKKKKKEKKEKPPKPPKPPKPKKEKKPVEKDTSPPLPKSAIIVPVLLLATVVAAIVGVTSLVGYQLSVSNAKKLIAAGDYIEAYAELDGLDIKDSDYPVYMQAQILAAVQYQIDSYYDFDKLDQMDMALDCLVCGLGRINDNEINAEYYGIKEKLHSMKKEIKELLSTRFGVSEAEALDSYSRRRRTQYTHEIYDYLERAGMLKPLRQVKPRFKKGEQ